MTGAPSSYTPDMLRHLVAMKRLECPFEAGWLEMLEAGIETTKRQWFVRVRPTTRAAIEQVLERADAIARNDGTPGWLGRPGVKGKLHFDQAKLFGFLLGGRPHVLGLPAK